MIRSPRWRVYLDSNLFIRHVESADDALIFLLEQAADDVLSLHASELTLAEVLVDPLRRHDRSRAALFGEILTGDDWLQVVPVSRTILVRSAEVRAALGNKLPDAIHVATAMDCSCNVLVSSDRRLRTPSEMVRVSVDAVKDLDRWP
ncbi:type II toxin-antitoxin system VapC family toxin [Faunimonas sp. B44]|uniref:type II toxin-antitoxin system VapC family toxin n=1 Tax=Faunimonas sp. B44 TaxID=3461493 RepID=UPI0040444350